MVKAHDKYLKYPRKGYAKGTNLHDKAWSGEIFESVLQRHFDHRTLTVKKLWKLSVTRSFPYEYYDSNILIRRHLRSSESKLSEDFMILLVSLAILLTCFRCIFGLLAYGFYQLYLVLRGGDTATQAAPNTETEENPFSGSVVLSEISVENRTRNTLKNDEDQNRSSEQNEVVSES